LGRDKARCLAVRFLIPPVEHRACDFHRTRRSTFGRSPWTSMKRLFPFLQLHSALAATPKFEVKRHGASGPSNDCMPVPPGSYSASHFAGAAHSPWTACACAGYLCSHLSKGEGPSPAVLILVCPAFLGSDYYAPSDSFWGLGVSYGSPQSYSPLPFPSPRRSPVFTIEDSKRNAVGGVFLLAPSTLCGSPGTP
jgi:hypothetical protein